MLSPTTALPALLVPTLRESPVRMQHADSSKVLKIYQLLVHLIKLLTMAKNTSILLGDYFENFINYQVQSGKFSSASEVVRAAMRLLEREETLKTELVSEGTHDHPHP